ncbi:hypothetical protein ACFQYP_24560 [Nonomuraea antimicrobica]
MKINEERRRILSALGAGGAALALTATPAQAAARRADVRVIAGVTDLRKTPDSPPSRCTCSATTRTSPE